MICVPKPLYSCILPSQPDDPGYKAWLTKAEQEMEHDPSFKRLKIARCYNDAVDKALAQLGPLGLQPQHPPPGHSHRPLKAQVSSP